MLAAFAQSPVFLAQDAQPRRAAPPAPDAGLSAPEAARGGSGPAAPQDEAARAVPPAAEPDPASAADPFGLTAEERRMVDELAARDREVRAHEMAHVVVGGPYAGRPRYEHQVGPDSRRYAVGGEVPIDAAPVPNDPEATIAKMRIVAAAALAPPEPSATDRAVAALANARAVEARARLDAERRAESGAPEGVSRQL